MQTSPEVRTLEREEEEERGENQRSKRKHNLDPLLECLYEKREDQSWQEPYNLHQMVSLNSFWFNKSTHF